MFLCPSCSPASLSPLNRAFVGCHVGVSSGTWEQLLPADLLPASPGPPLRAASPDLLHTGPLAIRKTKHETSHEASEAKHRLLSSPMVCFRHSLAHSQEEINPPEQCSSFLQASLAAAEFLFFTLILDHLPTSVKKIYHFG